MIVRMAEQAVKRKKNAKISQNKKKYPAHKYVTYKVDSVGSKVIAVLGIIILTVVICGAIFLAARNIEKKNAEYDAQIALLTQQIADEEERKAELEYYSVYITTKQFIEEFAREKLGLVFEDELIFRPEDK